MYIERFTRDAILVQKKVLSLSVNAAEPRPVNTGLLVLALMDSPSFAAQLLERQGLRYLGSSEIETLLKQLPKELSADQMLAQSMEYEDVMIMSAAYATYRRSDYIDTEHLLMGLFCYNEEIDGNIVTLINPDIDRLGAQILCRFGINPWLIDQQIRRLTPQAKQLLSPY